MRLRTQPTHSNTVCGTFASGPNSGPSIASLRTLARRLGLASVLSVAGDRATTASGARIPWSRTQAINASARLPPAESPATNTALAGSGPFGPCPSIQR